MKKNNADEQARALVERLGHPSAEMLGREIARQDRIDACVKLALHAAGSLVMAACVIVLVTNLWLHVLQVDGTSMAPQMQRNDVILAAKTDTPGRQDVISFYCNNKVFVKRVIGTAGDWIDIDGDGVVSVNGNALSEPYVAEPSLGECSVALPFEVPSGTVFVMGDNRPVSNDSRGPLGPVDKEMIIGRVVFRLWPLSRLGRVR